MLSSYCLSFRNSRPCLNLASLETAVGMVNNCRSCDITVAFFEFKILKSFLDLLKLTFLDLKILLITQTTVSRNCKRRLKLRT